MDTIKINPPLYGVGDTVQLRAVTEPGQRVGVAGKIGTITKIQASVHIAIKEKDGTGEMIQSDWHYNILIDGYVFGSVLEDQIKGIVGAWVGETK